MDLTKMASDHAAAMADIAAHTLTTVQLRLAQGDYGGARACAAAARSYLAAALDATRKTEDLCAQGEAEVSFVPPVPRRGKGR